MAKKKCAKKNSTKGSSRWIRYEKFTDRPIALTGDERAGYAG